LVIKEGTPMLALPEYEKRALFGILREAYDGSYTRPFGNDLIRDYQNLHFHILMGVTHAIYGYNDSVMGERFLKFFMPYKGNRDKQIFAALDNTTNEKEIEEAIQKVVTPFLARKVSPKEYPKVPRWVNKRLVALAQLLSLLRTVPERDKFTSDLLYRPDREIGTRPAKQLRKLGMALAIVRGKRTVDYEIYRIMERVAFDSAVGFHIDVVRILAEQGECTVSEISEEKKIPITTLDRNLTNLTDLGVVTRRKDMDSDPERKGPKQYLYDVTPEVKRLWRMARVGQVPLAVLYKELEQ
jgi:predicted transcriptional regulator